MCIIYALYVHVIQDGGYITLEINKCHVLDNCKLVYCILSLCGMLYYMWKLRYYNDKDVYHVGRYLYSMLMYYYYKYCVYIRKSNLFSSFLPLFLSLLMFQHFFSPSRSIGPLSFLLDQLTLFLFLIPLNRRLPKLKTTSCQKAGSIEIAPPVREQLFARTIVVSRI